MPELDYEQIRQCLDEIEAALFKVADSEECQRFHKDTQLTATVLLLLRMSSLIRPLLVLLQSEDFDGFDAVLRAFEENYYLAHEFRLIARNDRASAWLVRDKNSWSPRIDVVREFIEGRGHHNSKMGHDYGLLSELAHPKRTAAENAVTLCGVRQGIPGADAELKPQGKTTQSVSGMRYTVSLGSCWTKMHSSFRFLWLPRVCRCPRSSLIHTTISSRERDGCRRVFPVEV